MKQKILGAFFIVAMAVTTGWNLKQNKDEMNVSDLTLANAEALARGETDEWYSGYRTGKTTINGITIPCCEPSSPSDACNYGKVDCITLR